MRRHRKRGSPLACDSICDVLEYKENEELNNFAVLLRSRKDILCYKFNDNIRKRLDRKKGAMEDGLDKKRYLTEMISVNDTLMKEE
jgi:hypothetical protein